MISSISLQNFQSHSSSLLEFDPGINILIGDSDSGKTAILRALNWVLTNRPTGEAFRRYGSEKTIVTVDTSDGSISRIRSNRENHYLHASEEKLAAIGTSVPEPVLKLLRMDPDLNIQRQMDAPFLLSCSAGEVAQRLNAVVGLDDIDAGLFNAARRVKQNQAQYEDAVESSAALTEQVALYAYLGQMEQDIQQSEEQFRKLLEVKTQAGRLGELLETISVDQFAFSQLPDVDRALEGTRLCDERLQNYNKISEQVTVLSAWLIEIQQMISSLKKLPDISDALMRIEESEGILGQLSALASLEQCGTDILGQYTVLIQDIKRADRELAMEEERFHKEMPTVCPLCGKKGKEG